MCNEDKKCDNDKDRKEDEKVDEFMETFREHGIGCGIKIADTVKEIHPDALAIVPLYRSCIVVVQSEEEKKDGTCTLHSYADPHWMGAEIDVDTLKLDDFHFEFVVQGDRQGPAILKKHCGEKVEIEDIAETYDEDEDLKVLEHDEN